MFLSVLICHRGDLVLRNIIPCPRTHDCNASNDSNDTTILRDRIMYSHCSLNSPTILSYSALDAIAFAASHASNEQEVEAGPATPPPQYLASRPPSPGAGAPTLNEYSSFDSEFDGLPGGEGLEYILRNYSGEDLTHFGISPKDTTFAADVLDISPVTYTPPQWYKPYDDIPNDYDEQSTRTFDQPAMIDRQELANETASKLTGFTAMFQGARRSGGSPDSSTFVHPHSCRAGCGNLDDWEAMLHCQSELHTYQAWWHHHCAEGEEVHGSRDYWVCDPCHQRIERLRAGAPDALDDLPVFCSRPQACSAGTVAGFRAASVLMNDDDNDNDLDDEEDENDTEAQHPFIASGGKKRAHVEANELNDDTKQRKRAESYLPSDNEGSSSYDDEDGNDEDFVSKPRHSTKPRKPPHTRKPIVQRSTKATPTRKEAKQEDSDYGAVSSSDSEDDQSDRPLPSPIPQPSGNKPAGWCRKENVACIKSFKRLLRDPKLAASTPALYAAVSDRLKDRYNIYRPASGVKSQWCRKLRLATGIDERSRRRTDNLQTSLLSPDKKRTPEKKRAASQATKVLKTKKTQLSGVAAKPNTTSRPKTKAEKKADFASQTPDEQKSASKRSRSDFFDDTDKRQSKKKRFSDSTVSGDTTGTTSTRPIDAAPEDELLGTTPPSLHTTPTPPKSSNSYVPPVPPGSEWGYGDSRQPEDAAMVTAMKAREQAVRASTSPKGRRSHNSTGFAMDWAIAASLAEAEAEAKNGKRSAESDESSGDDGGNESKKRKE